MPLTVTNLARACKLSRSTLLYYESIGLLPRPRRTAGNYRVYTPKDLDRLRQICVYRDAGVPLADIRSLLDGPRAIVRRQAYNRMPAQMAVLHQLLAAVRQAIHLHGRVHDRE